MSEAKAFAAGYKAAIDILEDALKVVPADNPGREGIVRAIIMLEIGAVPFVANLFESWQLSQNPDFQESLAQMQRGEGREIDFEDGSWDERLGKDDGCLLLRPRPPIRCHRSRPQHLGRVCLMWGSSRPHPRHGPSGRPMWTVSSAAV